MATGDVPKCFDCGGYLWQPHLNCESISFPKYDSYYELKRKFVDECLEEPFPDFFPEYESDYQSNPKLNPTEEDKTPMLADILRQKSHDANVVQVNLAYDRMINLVKDEADEGYRESHFMVKALKLNQPGAVDALIERLKADGLEVTIILKDCGVNGKKEQLVIKW